MGVAGVDEMSQEEYRKAAVEAVRKLASDVGIPADLKGDRKGRGCSVPRQKVPVARMPAHPEIPKDVTLEAD